MFLWHCWRSLGKTNSNYKEFAILLVSKSPWETGETSPQSIAFDFIIGMNLMIIGWGGKSIICVSKDSVEPTVLLSSFVE